MNKHERLAIIKTIIQENKITSQQHLKEYLEAQNIAVTQATLSRDMKRLKVVKVVDSEAGHIYSLPIDNDNYASKVNYFPVDSFKSIKFSGNLAVIKSTPSFASSMALIIDQLNMDEMIGSIAGDDTVMIILSEGTTPDAFLVALRRRIPVLRDKII